MYFHLHNGFLQYHLQLNDGRVQQAQVRFHFYQHLNVRSEKFQYHKLQQERHELSFSEQKYLKKHG